jgi:pimeloyl-ACP methyl ester carboxylesterase
MPSHSPVPLAYDRSGSGEPLVLVHPLGGDRGVWEPVLPYLTGHHDTIAVDMPGFGESAELPEGMPATAGVIAASIEATLDSVGVERAHVAGNSLGGWVALEFGKSERCLSVTTLCAAGFWGRPLGPRPEIARSTALRLVPVLRPLLATARGRRLVLRGPVAHPERVPAKAAYRLVRAYALSPGFGRANAEMRRTLFSGFEEISVPITMAWAEHDRSVSAPAQVPARVHAEYLAGCGHVPTWDDPQRVAQVILATTDRAGQGAEAQRQA